jgi:ketosteroid isomerase-like protein
MTITKEEVAEAVRAWCHAWHTGDIETLLAMEAPSFGFGFRPFTPRDHVAEGQAGQRERFERFFGRMDSYSLVPEDFETAVVGELGMAWGTFMEQWQDKGQPPEQARVRFSKVLTKGAQGWQVLLYHRDIQPFETGRYPKTLTVVSSDR